MSELTQIQQDFMSMWSAYFTHLGKREGVDQWLKFIQGCTWSTLEQAIMVLVDDYNYRKENSGYKIEKPDLYALKKAYWRIRDVETGKSDVNCSLCKNCGYIKIVMYDNGDKWLLCDPGKPFACPSGKLGVFAGSCVCKHGDGSVTAKVKSYFKANSFGSCISGVEGERAYIKKCNEMYNKMKGG